tara:strand:- start:276 stop:1016 length:741 start_codon:yes stop_codon:yes gene_type:complete
MIFRIAHSKFGTVEADVINNKLVINKVYHSEKHKWDITYKGYDLWKYGSEFAIYHKDNKFIGYGIKNYSQNPEFVEVNFSKRPNRNIVNNESPKHENWDRSIWSMHNISTYDFDKINDSFINGKIYEVLTDAEKLERDKRKEENWDKATCGACHRLIQLDGDRIWDHGYTMRGFRNGSCVGRDHRSWEHSPEGKITLIKTLESALTSKTIQENQIKFLTRLIEEAKKEVDNWKPAKTPRELQEVAQ